MFTRFNLKNSKGDSNVLIDQYSILLATVYLKLGKNRKRNEFEEKFADTNEDFIDSKYHFSHYRDFLPLLKNYITNNPSKYNAKKYQTLFEYMKKTELDENEKRILKDNKNYFFNDFFSIIESHHNAILNKIFFVIFWLGVFGIAISGLLIYIRIESKYSMNYLGIAFIGGSVLSLIIGGLSYLLLHGKVKSTWLKSRFLINVECCFQRLDELEMSLTQKLNLNCNDKFKGNYDNPDDFCIPFAARVHKENPTLHSNIINTFIELNYIQVATGSKKLKAIAKEIVVTYFRENCPKIKAKEYAEFFINLTKISQINGNNLNLKKSDKGEYVTRKTTKYKDEIEKCSEKHKIVAPDNKNPENSGQR